MLVVFVAHSKILHNEWFLDKEEFDSFFILCYNPEKEVRKWRD